MVTSKLAQQVMDGHASDYTVIGFDAVEIRDTSEAETDIIDNTGFRVKSIIIENDLNEDLSLECWASRHADFSHSFLVGAAFPHDANTDGFQTCDSYFPFMRMKATCAVAPTTGSLTIAFVSLGD